MVRCNKRYAHLLALNALVLLAIYVLVGHLRQSYALQAANEQSVRAKLANGSSQRLQQILASEDDLNIVNDALSLASELAKAAPAAEMSEEATDFEPISESHLRSTLTQRLDSFLGCTSFELSFQRQAYGDYWLVRNLFIGSLSRHMGCAESISYTTHGDYTFFDNVETVASRWLGPISFAIFAPGDDFHATLRAVQYVRNCLPQSELVRQYVSFHVYFPKRHMPHYVPKSEAEALQWPIDCAAAPSYLDVNRTQMYKAKVNLTYPINVGRNIARRAVNTHFVFACDIELYPSPNFIQSFLEMVDRNHSVLSTLTQRVFPLPVFELAANATLPNNKTELLQMLQQQTAIPFHMHVCKNCHEVPKQAAWLNATDTEEMSVLSVSRRQGRHKSWEPFYISDNQEPLFDERVTWEGQNNKRIQGYAMCLLDYEFHILHPAFLVHSPGIKYVDRNSTRFVYAREMGEFIKQTIEPEYRILFGQNSNCKL